MHPAHVSHAVFSGSCRVAVSNPALGMPCPRPSPLGKLHLGGAAAPLRARTGVSGHVAVPTHRCAELFRIGLRKRLAAALRAMGVGRADLGDLRGRTTATVVRLISLYCGQTPNSSGSLLLISSLQRRIRENVPSGTKSDSFSGLAQPHPRAAQQMLTTCSLSA